MTKARRHTGDIGKPEKETQDRLLDLFEHTLGYDYLGDRRDRENDNVEEDALRGWLEGRGHDERQQAEALRQLREASLLGTRTLYDANQATYELLRYGAKVRRADGTVKETVAYIDWDDPLANDFAVAEEVTLRTGDYARRPDLVLYVNGIAVGVIELKNARTSVGEGIRQLRSNQQPRFNAPFFTTVQLCLAGNDTEGMRYGTVGTDEAFYLTWKEAGANDVTGYALDRDVAAMCGKERLIELMADFVVFDGGIKKLPRHNQYFGVKRAQERFEAEPGVGGIVWHTQGSGKSLTMVMLARWILETKPGARIAIVTDRTDLEKQIKGVFEDAGTLSNEGSMARATSGEDLIEKLEAPSPRLIFALVQKFGAGDGKLDAYLKQLGDHPVSVHGDLYVFVDEAHRTQSGDFNQVMRTVMPDATFVGFTGTPLLKKDKPTSRETFGRYIHTYLHTEAVADGVVLDLVYEARDVDQRLTSQARVDQWFEAKTKNLNDWQKNELRQRWTTLQKVLSARSRRDRIIEDIIMDFGTKPRLASGQGNAMLVANSIYEATKYYAAAQATPEFKDRCALVTSHNPHAGDVSKEDVGANQQTELQFVYDTYTELLAGEPAVAGKSASEAYEDRVKALFQKQPATMKLLIVVNKLLTGFDAPPCTYLYIDKKMQDHDLFQAICRTNRLDGPDKPFGCIVDYKDLFRSVEKAIAVYTNELDREADLPDPDVMMATRLELGAKRLEDAEEQWQLVIEPVAPPKDDLAFLAHFCGNARHEGDLEEKRPVRVALYHTVATYARAFTNLVDDAEAAGLSDADVEAHRKELRRAVAMRDTVRTAAGEVLDFKPFEADMRYLIDSYIAAEPPEPVSAFDDLPLIDLIVETGIADAINARLGAANEQSVAEVIENNIRSTLIRDHLNDPAFYERMSVQLEEVIDLRKERAVDYAEYLKRVEELAKRLRDGDRQRAPADINTAGRLALWNNLGEDAALAMRVDSVLRTKCPDDWVSNPAKQAVVMGALYEVLQDEAEAERLKDLAAGYAEYRGG